MLGMLTSPPPIFPCRRATNVSARWDWIRVTLSKSRNNYYCLVSTLDRQLFGGDELTDTVGKRTSRTD